MVAPFGDPFSNTPPTSRDPGVAAFANSAPTPKDPGVAAFTSAGGAVRQPVGLDGRTRVLEVGVENNGSTLDLDFTVTTRDGLPVRFALMGSEGDLVSVLSVPGTGTLAGMEVPGTFEGTITCLDDPDRIESLELDPEVSNLVTAVQVSGLQLQSLQIHTSNLLRLTVEDCPRLTYLEHEGSFFDATWPRLERLPALASVLLGASLLQAKVDAILFLMAAALASKGTPGTVDLSAGAAPSASGLTWKTQLQTAGWTVNTGT